MYNTPITLQTKTYKNEERIFIRFPYDKSVIGMVKSIPGRRWSASKSCWHVPNTKGMLQRLQKAFENYPVRISEENTKNDLNAKFQNIVKRYQTYLRGKRYSKSTIESYSFLVADFLKFHNTAALNTLDLKAVESYIETVFIKRRYSISTQRQLVSALKLFKNFCPEVAYDNLELERPKRDKRLPTVISKEAVITLIQVTRNLKHRAIIALIYSCGLRVGEVIQLELKHFDLHRRQLRIRNAKGRKDRYVIIAESFLPLLQNYLNTYQPERYFVEGQDGKRYSAGSIRKFLKQSCERAGINKRVTPHTLRHSYATHLLESGIDLRYIQELLGHAKPETTMIYTHVAKKDLLSIKSPLDIAVKQFLGSEEDHQKVRLSRT